MSVRKTLLRITTPALTLLVAALGMVTAFSMSSTQQKAEAFACFQHCSGPGGACAGPGPCLLCDGTSHCNC